MAVLLISLKYYLLSLILVFIAVVRLSLVAAIGASLRCSSCCRACSRECGFSWPHNMQNLPDQESNSCIVRWVLNHWTSREVQRKLYLKVAIQRE